VDDLTLLEQELKQFIIDTMRLEDLSVDDIDSDAPLFFDGLGLDSLDALELGVGISKKYDIKLNNTPKENQKIFSNVKAMAKFVSENRKK
jgi:acyl carrier protein